MVEREREEGNAFVEEWENLESMKPCETTKKLKECKIIQTFFIPQFNEENFLATQFQLNTKLQSCFPVFVHLTMSDSLKPHW